MKIDDSSGDEVESPPRRQRESRSPSKTKSPAKSEKPARKVGFYNESLYYFMSLNR